MGSVQFVQLQLQNLQIVVSFSDQHGNNKLYWTRTCTALKTAEQLCPSEPTEGLKGHLLFISILNSILSLTAFLGNSLILIALHKESSLHPPSKLLLRCLATTDLCVGLRDCAIIICTGGGGVLRLIGGGVVNLNQSAGWGGGVRCNFLNICRGVRS